MLGGDVIKQGGLGAGIDIVIIQAGVDNMFGMVLQRLAGRDLHPKVLLCQGYIGCGPGRYSCRRN